LQTSINRCQSLKEIRGSRRIDARENIKSTKLMLRSIPQRELESYKVWHKNNQSFIHFNIFCLLFIRASLWLFLDKKGIVFFGGQQSHEAFSRE